MPHETLLSTDECDDRFMSYVRQSIFGASDNKMCTAQAVTNARKEISRYNRVASVINDRALHELKCGIETRRAPYSWTGAHYSIFAPPGSNRDEICPVLKQLVIDTSESFSRIPSNSAPR